MEHSGVDDGAAAYVVWPERVPSDFESVFRTQYPSLLRTARFLTGDEGRAEEIVQEAFAAALLRWRSLGDADHPVAWIRRVVVNKSISVQRRRRTERTYLDRLRPAAGGSVDPDLLDVWDAIRRLPKRQAQVAVLVLLEDRPVAEAAAVLGCDEATVRTHLRRARAALAARLGVDDEEDRR